MEGMKQTEASLQQRNMQDMFMPKDYKYHQKPMAITELKEFLGIAISVTLANGTFPLIRAFNARQK